MEIIMSEKMKNLAYYGGKITSIEEMQIPMTDRVCWFADGVYDATCVRNDVIYRLDDHVDRFFRCASAIRIDLPFGKDELKALLTDLVSRVDVTETGGEALLYWQITRAAGVPRNHNFPKNGAEPTLWVTVTPRALPDPFRSAKLISYEDIRYYMCNVKTLCLLPNVLASQAAEDAGADECVQYRVNCDGLDKRVTEGAHTNVHCLKDGVFHTAPLDKLILPGISRKNLIRICNGLSIPVKEAPFSLDFFRDADELMISSSSNFCIRVTHLDGVPVGGKDPETLSRIQNALCEDYLTETNT
jgi:D-alanine transaminase